MLIHKASLHDVRVRVWCAVSATRNIWSNIHLNLYIYTD